MSVTTTINRNDYTGDGATLVFAYAFKIFTASDLAVYVNGVLKTLTTHYTVSGVGAAGGGNVTFVAGQVPPSGQSVAIVRAIANDQQTVWVDNDKFPASATNDAIDKLTMLCQQLVEKFGRAISFATSSTFKNVVFPDLLASKYLRVKSDATGVELIDLTTSGVYANPITTQGDLLTGGVAGVARSRGAG